MSGIEDKDIDADCGLPLRIGEWLWRPRYAKLWWTAVPVYWTGMLLSLRSEIVASFYQSAFAGFLTVFFFPPLVALILCYGFLRAWLAAFSTDKADAEVSDRYSYTPPRGPSGIPAELDPLDPRSGSLWIGSPLNPNNPIGFNRASWSFDRHRMDQYQSRLKSGRQTG